MIVGVIISENCRKAAVGGGIVAAMLLCGFVALDAMWARAWRDTTPRGPLTVPSEWPPPIREMHAHLADTDADLESFSVYLLYGQPGRTLSTVVCRMNDSDTAFDALKAHLALQPITGEQAFRWAGAKVLSYTSTDWWCNDKDDQAEYFASPNRVAGDEGYEYVVARDNGRKRIFVHYYYNF